MPATATRVVASEQYNFGDIVWVSFENTSDTSDHIQRKARPCVLVGHKLSLKNSPVCQVIPLTSKIKRTYIQGHVILKSGNLPQTSMLLPEQIMTVSKEKISFKIGQLSTEDAKLVKDALMSQLGI